MIYTDGSKINDRTAYSVVHNEGIIRKRINGQSSIFHAESAAIVEALHWKNHQSAIKDYVICTDSLSAISNLAKAKTKNYFKDRVHRLNTQISRKGSAVTFMWVPSHLGIPGNERADKEAKEAIKKLTIDQNEILAEETKKIIMNKIIINWQHEWTRIQNNKLREIKKHRSKVQKYNYGKQKG